MEERWWPVVHNRSHPGQLWREVCGVVRSMSVYFFFYCIENTSKPKRNLSFQCHRFWLIILLISEPIVILGTVMFWLVRSESCSQPWCGSTQTNAHELSEGEAGVHSTQISQIHPLWRKGSGWWKTKHLLSAITNPPQDTPKQEGWYRYTFFST